MDKWWYSTSPSVRSRLEIFLFVFILVTFSTLLFSQQKAAHFTAQPEPVGNLSINWQADRENLFPGDNGRNYLYRKAVKYIGQNVLERKNQPKRPIDTRRDPDGYTPGGRRFASDWIVKGGSRRDRDKESVDGLRTSARVLQSPNLPYQKPSTFMLVTGERPSVCKTTKASHLLMKSYKNKVDYCNLHACRVWYMLESWEEGFTGTWARYPALLRLMKSKPYIKWFMWMDADAIFTDLSFSIPFETYETSGKYLIVPGYLDKVYGDNPDWLGLNAGIFIIRNCEWSYSFLNLWRMLGFPGTREEVRKALNAEVNRPLDWNPDDQSALVYLLRKTKKRTAGRVYLEIGYALHGYWVFIVDKYEDMLLEGKEGREKWPFVTHFCGCNFCGSDPITERCSSSFERAFHFADNQLLAQVGLQHLHLNSSQVVPVP